MNGKTHIRSVIAKNVKKYRKINNLTQEALAEAAEVSNTYIANIECGQTWVSDKTLENIATALHIEVYLLFIPIEETKDFYSIEKRQKIIEYLNKRENELETYVKDFFSKTFEQILDEQKN